MNPCRDVRKVRSRASSGNISPCPGGGSLLLMTSFPNCWSRRDRPVLYCTALSRTIGPPCSPRLLFCKSSTNNLQQGRQCTHQYHILPIFLAARLPRCGTVAVAQGPRSASIIMHSCNSCRQTVGPGSSPGMPGEERTRSTTTTGRSAGCGMARHPSSGYRIPTEACHLPKRLSTYLGM